MSQYAELGLPLIHAGKVRELYQLPADDDGTRGPILMVATDNISAFDFVLDSQIPDKGAILTQLSLWWFEQLGVLHHVISTDVPDAVAGRAVVCEPLEMVPVECVARGYLTGSGWLEYQQNREVCGVELPAGLLDGSRLDEAIFTPATKAALGEHDENVDFDTMLETTGDELGHELREQTLSLYKRAEEIARERGLILADTKFEFGLRSHDKGDELVLADEVLTPDSSRFWEAKTWAPGENLQSFDKQYVRNWLLYESGWDRGSGTAPPPLPAEIVEATRRRYVDAHERLTGTSWVS